MDITDNSDIAVAAEEVIIGDVLDPCHEIVIEECSVEVQCAVDSIEDDQSTSMEEPFIPLEVEVEVQENVEVETHIDIAETVVKSELEEEELIIPTDECEVEIDQDINEFECIYIKENYLENMVSQEGVGMESEEDSDDSDSSGEKKTLKCQLCNRLFNSKATLNAHMLRHASEKFFCVICDKTFKKKHNLDFHMTMHSTGAEDVYKCTICPKTFPNRVNLTNHMMMHKMPARLPVSQERVLCNICNKSFQKSYLKIHMSSHYSSNDYTCTFCSKNLSSKQSLYMHMNTVHANEGCYECSYCEKRFFWKSYLDRHITVHTKEKSHHCTYCTKAFTRKLALRKHMSTHVVKGKYCLM